MLREIVPDEKVEKTYPMRITDFAKQAGASVDEIRYLERKGFLKSTRLRLKTRQVRQYRDQDLRRVQAIIKFRRQGFTWDAALARAEKEVQNPPLL